MVNHIEKEQILKSFIENIAGIADQDYQERVWVKGEGSECDDIDDTICDFFDESYILERYQDFGITEKQYELLINLSDKLRKFTDVYEVYFSENATETLIKIPQWKEIMETAKVILKEFNYEKSL